MSYFAPYTKTVKSYGILCFNKNKSNEVEICLVKRRFTYEFSEFVQFWSQRKIPETTTIFDRMTIEEKLDIQSLDYTALERRLYINVDVNSTVFQKRKDRFERHYVLHDGGMNLKKLINQSRNLSNLGIWEPPKGRKSINKKNETELECAIRETWEEANLPKENYRIYPDRKFVYTFIEDRVLYQNTYFVAIYNRHNSPPRNISMKNISQLSEVSEVRWLTLPYIRLISRVSDIRIQTQLEKFLQPVFTLAHKLFRNER